MHTHVRKPLGKMAATRKSQSHAAAGHGRQGEEHPREGREDTEKARDSARYCVELSDGSFNSQSKSHLPWQIRFWSLRDT